MAPYREYFLHIIAGHSGPIPVITVAHDYLYCAPASSHELAFSGASPLVKWQPVRQGFGFAINSYVIPAMLNKFLGCPDQLVGNVIMSGKWQAFEKD